MLGSMFFWLPALVEKSLVPIDASSLLSESIHQFPTISQLLFSPYMFGYSYPSPVDSLSFSLGLCSVLTVVALVIGMLTRRFKPSRFQVAVLLLYVGSVLLMLSQSAFLWRWIPVLQYLQFPWRLLFLTSLFGAYLAATLFTQLHGKYRWFVVVALFIAVIGMAHKRVDNFIHKDDPYYYSYSQTSTVQDENKPKTFTMPPGDLAPQTPLFEFETKADVIVWNGTNHEYTADSNTTQRVVESTAYFPGWQTKIDGKSVTIKYEEASGRIAYQFPEGKHHVKTTFTQFTPARLVGNALSLFVFVTYAFAFIWMKKYYKVTHHEKAPRSHR
jgi:hypothetical protein